MAGPVKGLFYGDASQLAAQGIAVLTNIIFVFAVMYAFSKVLNKITPLRVAEDLEENGLDMAEVAVNAYPEFSINR